MKRPTRRRLARHPIALAAALPVLAGCGLLSPTGTTAPYEPSDGVSASLGSVSARNLLIVGSATNAPGVVSGVLLNDGAAPVTVTLATGSNEPVPVTVPAAGSVLMGPSAATPAPSATAGSGTAAGAVVQFATMPSPAGAVVTLSLSSPDGGTTSVQVPVLPATLEYATITPTQGPTPQGTATATTAPTPTTAPTGTASAEATANPS